MKIYYDKGCSFCTKCSSFVEKCLRPGEDVIFLDIKESEFKDKSKETIVVVNKYAETFFFGRAIAEIAQAMVFPYNLGYYLPMVIMNPVYALMKIYRKI